MKTIEYYSSLVGEDLSSRRRKQNIVTARKAVFYLLRKQGYGLEEIAEHFGYGHPNVSYCARTFKELIETKDALAMRYYRRIKHELDAL